MAGAEDADKLRDSFVPFAAGRRNCIGQNLALLEIKLVLASLFRIFEFDLCTENIQSEFYVTLKPRNVMLRPRRRAEH